MLEGLRTKTAATLVAAAVGGSVLILAGCASNKTHEGATCEPNDQAHWESNSAFDTYYTKSDAEKYAKDLGVTVVAFEKGTHGLVDCHTSLAHPDANGSGASDIGSIVKVANEGKCVIEDFPPDDTQALVFCLPVA